MLKLYLFRHGEVEGADVKVFNGHTDVPLSAEGVRQFEEITIEMKEKKIDAVYASDLKRAKAGADMIAGNHSLKTEYLPDLREINFGIWDGLTLDRVTELYPEEMNSRARDFLNHRIRNGETLHELRCRVINSIQKIVSGHSGGSIVCVAHGGVNRVVVLWALGSPLSAVYSVRQDYGCMNIINFHKGGHMELETMNVSLFR